MKSVHLWAMKLCETMKEIMGACRAGGLVIAHMHASRKRAGCGWCTHAGQGAWCAHAGPRVVRACWAVGGACMLGCCGW